MRRLITAGILVLAAATQAEATTFTADEGRTLYIKGVVNNSIMRQAGQIELLSTQSSRPITLVINSPGGAVLPGMQFVSAMRVAQERGVKFRCFVPSMAASMAMIIYNECDERYALQPALFLWHSIRIGLMGTFTPEELKAIADQMVLLQQDTNERMIKQLGIPHEVFYYYYHYDFLIPGDYLKRMAPHYLQIVTDYDGIDGVF